jgi:hypothetical protein
MSTILSSTDNTIEIYHNLLYYSYYVQHIVERQAVYIWNPH